MKSLDKIREQVAKKTIEYEQFDNGIRSRQINAVVEVLVDYIQGLEGRILDLENNVERLKRSDALHHMRFK